MTEEELAAIRARVTGSDWPYGIEIASDGYLSISIDGHIRADAKAFLAEIDRLRGALERILAEHKGIAVGDRTYCRLCVPGDASWPCVTVLEARAALGMGE